MAQDHSISATEIADLIARRGRSLTFPPRIEAIFEARTGAGRCRELNRTGIIALILYECLMLADWMIIPDVIVASVLIHLLVVGPVALLVVRIEYRMPPPWLREFAQVAISVMIAVSLLVLTYLSRSFGRIFLHFSMVEVLLFLGIVQQVRFAYTAAASALVVVLHLATVMICTEIPLELRFSANALVTFSALLMLMANRRAERAERNAYLFGLLDTMRLAELDRLVRLDPLTGLLNRRGLNGALASLPISGGAVLLLDVDCFKAFNDRYGHGGGDMALRSVAQAIRDNVPLAQGVAGRYGGEEFMVVCPGTDAASAQDCGERIRAAVEALAIPHAASLAGPILTLSVGVALARPGGDGDPQRVVLEADANLYRAKAAGRNRVIGSPGAGTALQGRQEALALAS